MALTISSPPIFAQQSANTHDHQELQHSSEINLRAAVLAAEKIALTERTSSAYRNEGEVLSKRSKQWLSGVPSVQFRYQTDALTERQPAIGSGLREQELGVELPLWRWGQRSAIRLEADAANAYATQFAQWQSWQVAGAVRDSFWQERRLAAQVEQATRVVESFLALEHDTARRVRAGESASVELLIAESARHSSELTLHEAESAHIDAQYRWRSLTGLSVLPEQGLESITANVSIWPPLACAQAWLARQEKIVDVQRRQGAGVPRVLIGTRRERAQFDASDSLGVTLSIPFSGKAHSQAALLPAQLQLAEAQDNLRLTQRAEQLAHHEAHHDLNARDLALKRLSAQLVTAQEEIRLMRKAYQLGETSMQERLLSEQRFADISRQQRLADIDYSWAIARFNQMQGQMP